MTRVGWFVAGVAATVGVKLVLDVLVKAVPTDEDVWGVTADGLCPTCNAPIYYPASR